MKTCPRCEGKGKLSITAQVYENGKFRSEPPVGIDCPTCEGKGKISDRMLKEIKRMDAMWCSCDNRSGEAYYVEDGVNPECRKHHWRCKDCGKILQVG